MAKVTSLTDYCFEVQLTEEELAALKKQATLQGVRYADFVCHTVKRMVELLVEKVLG